MAEVLSLPRGRTEIVSGWQDFLELAEEYMGSGARRWLEEREEERRDDAEYAESLERELGQEEEKHMDAMRDVLRSARRMSELLREGEPDLEKLSREADIISAVAMKGGAR